ncbi:hypothetical protein W9K_01691 [Acinetobacter baumannii Ab33333]|nr:hypothetical protein W9K_01691 [Acinetobacter baumannii Ab33333]KFG13499.1 hypothetical protein ABBL099_01133 [Acinetobacter baumannii]
MFEITSHMGAGLIKFGMKREEIRKIFLSMNLECLGKTRLLMAMMNLGLV